MNVLEALRQRRSVKHFDTAHVMPAADITQLLAATLYSPTSFNIQNWRFVAVTELDVKKQLRAAAWDQPQVSEASLIVVICADVKAWEKQPQRYWRNAPEKCKTKFCR